MISEQHAKIAARHLTRNAYLYVRQSSLRQVFENTESTQRQYALRERAIALGWPIERVHVIDSGRTIAEGTPAEVRISDSLVMVSSAEARDRFPGFLYVYVDDADATFRRAVEAGAVTVEEPLDTPYGDRRAMVRDRFGNVYQIAHVTRV